MSPGDPAPEPAARASRILAAAQSLGVRAGVGALSLQAIAEEAGVSKALLLYHFTDKSALLVALAGGLARESAGRLAAAARSSRAMDAWRALLLDPAVRGEAALLNALALEGEVPLAPAGQAARETAATTLAVAVLADVGLAPRVPAPAIGRALLRQLDGLAAATPHGEMDADALEAELDTFALSLLGLAR